MRQFKHSNYRQPLLSLLLLTLVVSFSGISSEISATPTPQKQNIDIPNQIGQFIKQNRLISSISSFWQRKPRRKRLGSRGGICPVSPGLVDTYFIWSDRPLFLWYSPEKKEIAQAQLIVRDETTEDVVWTQIVNLTDQKVFYSGKKSLEPGKVYQWQLVGHDDSNITLPSTFEIMAASDRDKIQADLHALEQKLKVNKASQEEIALQQADYFANYQVTHKTENGTFSLWSDSLESLYKVEQPSPSFVATTANAMQFGNQGVFSATNPQAPPLLTIEPSALLFNQINQTAVIANQSQAPAGVDITGSNVTGLRVSDGKSLLLVGGNVNLDGGGLTADGGRIELAGLTAPGTIGLNVAGDTFSLNVPSGVQLGDISLTNQALVSVYGAGGGDVAINAHNLEISNNSYIFGGIVAALSNGSSKAGDININADSISLSNGAEITNFTSATGDAGDIFIRASNAISVDGSLIVSDVFPGAVGNGGDINIQARNVSLTNNGQITSIIYGNGDSGNIFITALNAISLDSGFIATSVLSSAVGNGGDINIQARNVSLTNGGVISSGISGQGNSGNVSVNVRDALTISGADSLITATLNIGAVGSGGNINIQARNVSLTDEGIIASGSFGQGSSGNVSVNVRDALTISGLHSSILTTLGPDAVGSGGDINIQAGNVSLTNSGDINSSTFGKGDSGNIHITARDAISLDDVAFIANNVQNQVAVGNAGSIDITTGSLSVTNGAEINSFTLGTGNAGNITIIASDAVTFDGVDRNGNHSASYSTVNPGALGNGGDINVTTRSLSLTNGGELGVSVNEASNTLPSGQGIAGNININADTLRLSKGLITAQAASSDGGNIKLNLSDYLLLRNSSQISTNAGTANAGGNGGNITINTPFIVAVPNENSDITANAFSGEGGNIYIKVQNLFGIAARPQPSNQTNDITASSQLGVQGQIAITQPQVQPTQGIAKLPNQVIDASKQIAQNCPRSPNAKPLSKFIITGHGSLPPSPLELMVGTTTRIPLATLDDDSVVPSFLFYETPNIVCHTIGLHTFCLAIGLRNVDLLTYNSCSLPINIDGSNAIL